MLNFFFLEHVGSLAEFSQTGGKRKLRLEDLRVGTHVYSPMIKNYHSEKNQGYLYSLTLEFNYIFSHSRSSDYITIEGLFGLFPVVTPSA